MLSPALPLIAPSLRASLTPPKTRTILPTGLAELDACLPGGGWPQGGLVELVQGHRPHPFCRQAAWSLLLPALQQLQRPLVEGDDTNPGWLGWVGDGGVSPYAPSLAAQGLDMHRFIWIVTNRGDTPVAAAWAAEQLLRCESVQAVVLQGLAATPQAPSIQRLLHAVRRRLVDRHLVEVARCHPVLEDHPRQPAVRVPRHAERRCALGGDEVAVGIDHLGETGVRTFGDAHSGNGGDLVDEFGREWIPDGVEVVDGETPVVSVIFISAVVTAVELVANPPDVIRMGCAN